jgi:hypothetical protein
LEVEAKWWQRVGGWLRTKVGIAVMLALVLVAALGFSAGTIYRQAKQWRAGRLIARSEEAQKRGDEAEYFRRLREAYILAPETALTLRAVAHFHEQRGEAAGLPLYERLLTMPEATADDALRGCRLALRFGKVELGRKWLADLQRREETRARPAVLSLEAQLLALENHWDDALATARKAATHPGDASEEKLALALLLLRAPGQSPDATRIAEAIDLFAGVIPRPDEVGAQALGTLVALAREPAASSLFAGRDVTPWVDAASRHPKTNARLRVAAWDLHLAARPSEAEKTIDAFLANWREAPLPGRLEAARWLNQHGQPAKSLEISTAQKDVSADWLLVHLDSLAATGRWDTVLEILQSKSGQVAAMPAALRALFAFRARIELGQAVDRAEFWRDLQIQLQTETVANQLYIAQYAEKIGETAQVAAIFRRLLDRPLGKSTFGEALSRDEKLACYSGLIRNTPGTAPAAELAPLLEALSAEFPEMDEAANDAIYLRLLIGQTNNQMRDRALRLVQAKPAMLAYRTTLALYELRAGHTAEAAKLYDGWQIDWTTAPDRFKAVRAAVCEASGQAEEARILRAAVDVQKLRPEESALLEEKGDR